ncbi:DUF2304 domain-containing protein [Melissococcus sp. OM08-11BH]|uniref:DUF2304 domain-containing protein n=1 Tax=Melissococcus sp. OM08-11BH TaxID=2293110 RepID=UPI000E498E7A|nr:DUF2304 domain-containing protein [Melissococcus sp. OM08-11BH]RGI32269.1 DUF2304 domain-containing protein [Melissococcus sp. OM08-11BH]
MEALYLSMIFFSLLFLFFVIRSIRKSTFSLEYSLLWLTVAIIMVVFAIFPKLPEYLSSLLGFETMSNFILVMAVLFSLLQLISMTKQITKQSNQIKKLIQEVSILKEEFKNKERDK